MERRRDRGRPGNQLGSHFIVNYFWRTETGDRALKQVQACKKIQEEEKIVYKPSSKKAHSDYSSGKASNKFFLTQFSSPFPLFKCLNTAASATRAAAPIPR